LNDRKLIWRCGIIFFSCSGRKAIVSSAFPHFGEESVLQGWNGSGTIFFGMCNLRCVFCQNWDISQKKNGWELDGKEIADLMLKLQNETKCHNINFVTPTFIYRISNFGMQLQVNACANHEIILKWREG